MKAFASFALAALAGLVLTPTLKAQAPITEGMGSYVKSSDQKAMEFYGRGLKLVKKAEKEEKEEKKMDLYRQAKDMFSKSCGYVGNYDAYLALGQTYLKLGQKGSALDACAHAQGLKPNDTAAKGCLEEARRTTTSADKPADKPAAEAPQPPGGR
jgi:cytochrome c-type biogenesis protein CcmH/NrfG